MIWAELACVLVLVLVHLLGRRIPFTAGSPRSRWLSAAGGMSVAYVFVHVFPNLARSQETLGEAWALVPFAERHAYLVALAGLVAFYGLEDIVSRSQRSRATAGEGTETTTGAGVFWLHMASFGVYNALVGYLLVRGEVEGLRAMLFYALAMAVHFAITDHALRQDHRETYRRVGRWILAAAIVAGWVLGRTTAMSAEATATLLAFLAGGIIMNVMKEEEPGAACFLPFLAGAMAYAALLLASF